MGENRKNCDLVHVGADLERDIVEKFREACETRHFFKKTVLTRLLQWWVDLPPDVQEDLYHRYRPEAAEAKIFSGTTFRDAVRKILEEERGAAKAKSGKPRRK